MISLTEHYTRADSAACGARAAAVRRSVVLVSVAPHAAALVGGGAASERRAAPRGGHLRAGGVVARGAEPGPHSGGHAQLLLLEQLCGCVAPHRPRPPQALSALARRPPPGELPALCQQAAPTTTRRTCASRSRVWVDSPALRTSAQPTIAPSRSAMQGFETEWGA